MGLQNPMKEKIERNNRLKTVTRKLEQKKNECERKVVEYIG